MPLALRPSAHVRIALVAALAMVLVAVPPVVPPAVAVPAMALTKDMAPTTLYGDVTGVSLTAVNSGTDGFNTSFTDTLPAGITLDDATPAPTSVLPQLDGSTVLVWENVADALSGASVRVDYTIAHDPGVFGIGDVVVNDAAVFVSDDPRAVPDFDPVTGASTGDADATATATASTELVPFDLVKSEPSTESELLRGVHDHQTVHTLEVRNNLLLPTTDVVIDDWLPAGLEFLGCGLSDNSTVDADGGTVPVDEYPGSGAINPGNAPATPDCSLPSLVETVDVDPDGAGPLGSGVRTHVRWSAADLGSPTLAPTDVLVLEYVAAIPLRSNALFGAGAPATTVVSPAATAPPQTANLDNNTGPLTADEQGLTNYALVAGTTDGVGYTDDATQTVVAEDVSIHKSVVGGLGQGGTDSWTLLVETSEYVTSSGPITVTDTMPDGVTVTSGDYDSAVENPDGTWTITWTLAGVPSPSGSTTLGFVTTTDTDYTTTGGGGPIASNDSLTNTVDLAAPSVTVIDDNTGTTATTAIVDESAASVEADGVTIEKLVATPGDVGDPADCTAGGISWVESAVDHTVGDTVCWRVALDFPVDTDTLDVVVRDYLPAGYSYVGFTYGPGNTAGAADSFSDEGAYQEWGYAGIDTGGRRFEVVVESTLDDVTAVSNADITANLAKATYVNTAGDVFQLRDQAEAVVATPVLDLVKQVADVDDVTTGFPAATATVVAGDVVTYEVVVTNAGDRDAVATEVWDVLPVDLECPTVSAISDGGSCETGPDPDRIEWSGLTVPAGGSLTLTYDATVPADVAPGVDLANEAGVRQYEAETNEVATTTYVPADNIDATQTPNTTAADDTATISTPDSSITKTRVTSVVDAAGGNLQGEATIAESITWTVTGTIPAGTTVDGLVTLTDSVPAGLTIQGTPTYTTDTGAGPGAPQAATVAGQDVTVPISGAGYVNPTGSGDDVWVLTITAVVDDVAGNVRNALLRNDAELAYSIGADPVSRTASVDTRVVEPALGVTKDEDDADDVVDAGDVLTYTVTVANGGGGRDSSAFDVEVVDTIPDELVPQDGGADAADGATLPGGGVWDETSRTITWTPATVAALGEIEPAATVVLTYDVRVRGDVVGGAPVTNTVVATTSSLPGTPAGERDATSPNGGPGSGYTATTDDTVSLDSPSIAKSVDPTSATIGEPVTATLLVTIPGGSISYDVTVLDGLPGDAAYVRTVATSCDEGGAACSPAVTVDELGEDAGTVGWFLGDLTPSAAADRIVTIEYVMTVGAGAVAGDDLDNSASVLFNAADDVAGTPPSVPDPADFDGASGPVVASVGVVEPDVSIVKSVDPADADPGDMLTYEIEVTNAAGPDVSTAYDVVVTDPVGDPQLASVTTATTGLPPGVTLVGGAATPPYTWTIDEIAPGASVTLTYTATLEPSSLLVDADTVENTATADDWTSLDTDAPPPDAGTPRTYGPVDDDVTVDLRFPAVSYDKAVGGAGDAAAVNVPFEWVVTLVNTGDGDAFGVDVSDTLPPAWTYDGTATASVDGGAAFTPPNQTVGTGDPVTIDWADVVATLPAGSTLVITFTATPTEAAQTTTGTGPGSPHTNEVTATGEDASGATGNADGPYVTNADDPGATTPATADAFLPAPGTIGDTVWIDRDGDGLRDAGWETDRGGIAGVTVTLTGTNGVTRSTVTAADGTYLFETVPPGDYTVTVDTSDPDFPAGLSPSSDGDGTGTPDTSDLTLAAAGTDRDQDFGYVGDGSIGDTVFLDLDRDGSLTGTEPGIEGITVTLLDDTGSIVATTVTDADGMYLFTGVPDGDWTVVVTPPAGADPTADPDGGDDDRATTTIDDGNPDDLDQDFGYAGDLAVGDTVFLDLDGDGAQTGLEPGIGGVTVDLLDDDGDVVATTTTDVDGEYLFENLLPGDWTVRVDPSTLPGTPDRTVDADGVGTPDRSTTTLTTADDLDQDFGYAGTGSIGDLVWLDLDEDGVVDGDEAGIPGATVELRDDSGRLVATTTTDADGGYLFENLPPGDWTVTVAAPAGYAPTSDVDGIGTPSTATVTLTDGEDRDDVDFGYSGAGAIGDVVFVDLDEDGLVDPDEPGIAAVPVALLLDGVLVATTTTDADGGYLFENLPPGDYQVVLDDDFLPPGFDPTVDPDGDATPHEADVTLADGEERLDVDFGYIGEGLLGDRVWLDRDTDGVQDPDEPGIAGVTVELLDDGGDVIDTRVTDATGRYVFSNLFAGDYAVRVVTGSLPAGMTQTADADGTGTPDRSDVTLVGASPAPDLTQDFGYVGSLSIGDTVFLDLDEDGTQGPLEKGIAGVSVSLVDVATGLVVGATTTDAGGGYLFDGLDGRQWRVEVDRTTLVGTVTQATDADGLATADASTTTLVDSDDLDQDFGYVFDGRIGDRVFFDTDADGVDDGVGADPGLPGVTVELYDGDGDLVATTTTDGAGGYLFDGLPADDYVVRVDPTTLPPGLAPSGDADGTGTPDESTLTLPVDGVDLDQDFGYRGTSAIGDLVFDDLDADGRQDADEPGVDGVVVRLYDGDGTLVARTRTDADGGYLFENLRPGDYVVEVVPPRGSVVTPSANAGRDDRADSDVDPTSGRTGVVTLASDTVDSTVDAGLVRTSSLGDLVFDDRDGDGVQDLDEPGIPGVVVRLHDQDGALVATTATDADGGYLFTGLLPGGYVVEFVAGDDRLLTAVDQGGDDARDSDADPSSGRTGIVTLGAGEVDRTVDAGVRLVTALRLTKQPLGALVVGEDVTYEIVVVNDGPNPVAGEVTVLDDVPDGLTWTGRASEGWDCSEVDGDVVCVRGGGLAVGAELRLTIVFRVTGDAGETVTNSASVAGGGVVTGDGAATTEGVSVLSTIAATGVSTGLALAAALFAVVLGALLVRGSRRRPTGSP